MVLGFVNKDVSPDWLNRKELDSYVRLDTDVWRSIKRSFLDYSKFRQVSTDSQLRLHKIVTVFRFFSGLFRANFIRSTIPIHHTAQTSESSRAKSNLNHQPCLITNFYQLCGSGTEFHGTIASDDQRAISMPSKMGSAKKLTSSGSPDRRSGASWGGGAELGESRKWSDDYKVENNRTMGRANWKIWIESKLGIVWVSCTHTRKSVQPLLTCSWYVEALRTEDKDQNKRKSHLAWRVEEPPLNRPSRGSWIAWL